MKITENGFSPPLLFLFQFRQRPSGFREKRLLESRSNGLPEGLASRPWVLELPVRLSQIVPPFRVEDDKMKDRYGVRLGETTEDRKLSLLSARCVGACGLAPAVVLDGAMLGNQSVDELLENIEKVT